jgi:polyhydroxyalkanoate synthesis regulator phasin
MATTNTSPIQDIIAQGIGVVISTQNATKNNISTSDAIKQQLYQNSTNIQNLINGILSKTGVVTQSEVDALDEEVRMAKLKLLEAEAKSATTRYALYVIGGLAVVGAIWYFTYKKI